MNRPYRFFYFLLFLISCGGNETSDIRQTDETIVLTERKSFEHKEGYLIRLWADDSLIYVSNAPDFGIYIYNHDGILVKKTGKAGPAPWENGTVWHFSRERSDRYWIQDYSKQLLKQFRYSDDSMLHSVRFVCLNNVQHLENNVFLVPKIDEHTKHFVLATFDARDSSFENVINVLSLLDKKAQVRNESLDFVFQGDFCANEKGQAVYFCHHAGVFFIADSSGRRVRAYKDVRNLPVPEASVRNNEIHLRPKQVVALSASMDGENVYMLTTKNAEDEWRAGKAFLIDVYELKTGRYRKSFNMPRYNGEERPFKIAKIDRGLVVAYESGRVVVYGLSGDT